MEEEQYNALKSHKLREAEHDEIARKTAEFLAKGGIIQRPAPVEKTISTVMTKKETDEWRIKLAIAQRSAEQYRAKRDPDTAHQKKTMHGDLTGKRFGLLVVTHKAKPGWWACVCDCGGQCNVQTWRLTDGIKVMCHDCVEKKSNVKIRCARSKK